MINSRLDFHEWKSTSNHWLSTKGKVPNACVGGWSPNYELEGLRYGELTMRVSGMCKVSVCDIC